jgi:hypothetical protein
MKKEIIETENLLKWQIAALAVSAVTVATVFTEAPKHKAVAANTDNSDRYHQSFEREREVETVHGQHTYGVRARYATVTGN